MELSIPYADLTTIVKKKTGKEVSFERVNQKTIKAGYNIPMPIIGSKHVFLNLTVDRITGSDVYLSFGSITSVVISGLLSHMKNQSVVEKASDNSVIVHLDRIDKIQKTLETISLKDITLCEEVAKVTLGVVK